ncbi:unnamed protein product, partial [Cyprideis torosa]
MGWEEWDASARSRGGLAGAAGSSGRAEMDLRLRRKQVEELQQKELAKIMERRDEKSSRDLDPPLSDGSWRRHSGGSGRRRDDTAVRSLLVEAIQFN